MTISEELFRQLLEKHGLMHRKHFWQGEEIFSDNKMKYLGKVPDFLLESHGKQLLVEIKEFKSQGAKISSRPSQSLDCSALSKPLVISFKAAKKQLNPYAKELKIPTMVVFYDTNDTHFLEKEIIETLFGVPEFIMERNSITGQFNEPIFHRGKGQHMNANVGTYISAVGVLNFDSVEDLVAWLVNDTSQMKPRIRIVPNPYAVVSVPLHFFKASKYIIYQ